MSGEPALHRKMYYLDVSLLVHSLFRHVDHASPSNITCTRDSLELSILLRASAVIVDAENREICMFRKFSTVIQVAANCMLDLFLFVETFRVIPISRYLPCISRRTFWKPFGRYSERREPRVP